MGQSESTSSRYESSKVMPPNAVIASTAPTQKEHMLVAAVDFGTTYTRHAFSSRTEFNKDPLKSLFVMLIGQGSVHYKVPTQVLIEKNGRTFKAKAFGYEAETEYVNAKDEEKESLFLFKRFKMSLALESGINKDVSLEDVLGKSLPALTVFSLSIGWLKNSIEKLIIEQMLGGNEYKPSNILWILTVPAIRNDAAKQFMREAAIQAGISNDHLELVLEPEAASIVCRHLTPGNCVGEYAKLFDLPKGAQYMDLNASDDSVDFNIYEVMNSCAVKEVRVVSIGCLGGVNVDNKFSALLDEITGPRFLGELRKQGGDDEVELLEAFKLQKRKMSPNKHCPVRIRIPLASFDMICQQLFNKDFAERLKESKFQVMVTLERENLWIPADLFKTFFTEAIDVITYHVKRLLEDSAHSYCMHILMVGIFSESRMLQEAVKNVCPGRTVIIPADAVFAVLKGAVAFGHDPLVISHRISKAI